VETYPLKPTWTSGTFLQYLGTAFALFSLGSLFGALQEAHGTAGLVGWSLLALVIAAAVAVLAQRRGEPIVAGLVAVIAVFSWAVFVASLLDLVGFDISAEADTSSFFNGGLAFGMILLELLVIAGAALALNRFGFPILVLLVAAVAWYAVVDLLEGVLGGGDTAIAILALLVGLAFVAIAAAADSGEPNPNAFWLHVAGGVSVGGAILWFWHTETWQWLLVLLVSLGYIFVARRLGRSSYAVLGALGLAGTATYFIEKWFSLGSLVPFFPAEPEDVDKWGRPLVYLALGAALVALGLLVGLKRPSSASTASSDVASAAVE
jgi:hypothetical protein